MFEYINFLFYAYDHYYYNVYTVYLLHGVFIYRL